MFERMPEVTDIHCVKNAKVPLMRFKFNGISVDFPYAQLQVVSVSEVSTLDLDKDYAPISISSDLLMPQIFLFMFLLSFWFLFWSMYGLLQSLTLFWEVLDMLAEVCQTCL